MTVSTRLKGNEGFHLTLKEGAGAATILGDDCKSYEVTSEDKDDSDLTFAEAKEGQTKVETLSLTGIVSFDVGSLWTYLWDNRGKTVAVVIAPKGNPAPAAGKPHFTGTGKLNGRPMFGNEARTSQEGAEFTYELALDGELAKVTA